MLGKSLEMFRLYYKVTKSIFGIQTEHLQSTQRGYYKEPTIFHERRQYAQCCDQLNIPLIWAILKPWGAGAVVRGGTRRTAARSGDKISVVLV